jgi:Caspase domain
MPLADRALVVGIDRYPGIGMLSGAENDAKDFHRWVTDPAGGGVDPGKASLILSSAFDPPIGVDDAKPVKEMIEGFFTEVDNAAEANNKEAIGLKAGKRLWLFFSGHGFAPSLDRSGVLMANATITRVHNIAAMLWADRLYQGGWFDEVILFQDACRGRIRGGDINVPFLAAREAPKSQTRRRFYAFSAKDGQLSKELPIPPPAGPVRGVFTLTLLQGLRIARDKTTGAVTTAQLKQYLQDNMKANLSAVDLNDADVAKRPEVFDPDPFDIVAATPAQIQVFPVRITASHSGVGQVLGADLIVVASEHATPGDWNLQLPRGIYKVMVQGVGEKLFEVTGALTPDGKASEVHVAL